MSIVGAVGRAAKSAAFLALLLAGCAPPSTPRVTPSAGAFRGGELVRIEGADFASHGPLVVYVCARSAKAVVIEGDRLVTIKTPRADEAGVCDVRLEFGDGRVVAIPEAYTFREATPADTPSSFDRLSAPPE